MSFYFQSREWMDQRIDPESNQVSEIFLGGVDAFIQFACNQEDYKERETLLCPCARCKNVKQREARVVARHLFLYGFKGNYYFWTSHGEKFNDLGPNDIRFSYNYPDVPPLFYHEGRINGQCPTGWLNDKDNTVLQTFMMLNCETFAPYERMFEEYMPRSIPDITPVAMQKAKDTNFAEWCKDYDDRRDQVAESSLLRVETHVVDDVSDYDLAPVNPPNDEYVSDVEMNSTRAPGTQAASPPMPPGATGPAVYHAASPPMPPGATGPAVYHAGSPPMPPGATGAAPNHAASSSRSNSYPQMTLNAMLNSPARLSQPHLHPDKPNGALWFGIDPCIHAFIRATWQGYYMGPWKSWNKVPEERKDSWWQTFVQNFYWEPQFNDLVYGLWKKETMTTTQASGEPPSYTALVRETHSRPDGTFVDYRAEELVTQAEMEATQLSNTEGSPGSPSASSAPSRLMLNKAYLKNAKSKREYVYGLGSEQFREHAPSSRVTNGIARNLDLEMRVGGLETTLQSVSSDVAGVKQDVSDMRQDFAATREAINQLLQTLRPPQAPTGQTSDHQAQAPTGQPNPLNGI
ncbi:hypothetical protein IGI04_015907 [Brassica rapa subsp. trilocularis]|uniref:Transposase-associated domain-containing protein n=1 Tax=Brassica rapa subsp. trilocularis TaxID=1813537 RepID=A0ABQ7MRV9_BRACM|nr:hypothetical protein IGI04_015907 [Brassica rapa subsp. trilocularis]